MNKKQIEEDLKLHFSANIDKSNVLLTESLKSSETTQFILDKMAPIFQSFKNNPQQTERLLLLLTAIFSNVSDESLMKFPASALFVEIKKQTQDLINKNQQLDLVSAEFYANWLLMFEFDPNYCLFVKQIQDYQSNKSGSQSLTPKFPGSQITNTFCFEDVQKDNQKYLEKLKQEIKTLERESSINLWAFKF